MKDHYVANSSADNPDEVPSPQVTSLSTTALVRAEQLIARALPVDQYFGVSTTVAAVGALAFAHAVHIHHPWWAAMTVWLVAQPTRGLLLERSLARFIGTGIGATAGTVILNLFSHDKLMSLCALALWLALCAGIGSTMRHFRTYSLTMAGFTGGLVVLLGLVDGSYAPELALDRVSGTAIGIVVSALASIHLKSSPSIDIAARIEALLQCCLRSVDDVLKGGSPHAVRELIADMQLLDDASDSYASGSLRRLQEVLRMRHIGGVMLELSALVNAPRNFAKPLDAPNSLEQSIDERIDWLKRGAAEAGRPALNQALETLQPTVAVGKYQLLRLPYAHLDMSMMWRAATRPVIALAASSILWLVLGWQAGVLTAMTSILFASLFASHVQGNQMLRQVLAGTFCGAFAGILVRLFVMPEDGAFWPTLFGLTPFLLIGTSLLRRPSTVKMATDLIMTFLLTVQPITPRGDAFAVINDAVAILIGVLIAAATYWFLLPATRVTHVRILARRIVALTRKAAQSQSFGVAQNALEDLRITSIKLLHLVPVEGELFGKALECLAAASRATAAKREKQSATANAVTPEIGAINAAAALALVTG
jgi:uncharacterized membrane protein YccC